MFGLRVREKAVQDIEAGEYLLLGGIKLLYISDILQTDGLFQLVTDAGKLLFPATDVLRVV